MLTGLAHAMSHRAARLSPDPGTLPDCLESAMTRPSLDIPRRPTPPAQPPCDDTLDTAFQLGWDHAHHGVTPPLERLCINPRLRHGFKAGRAVFGRRTLPVTHLVHKWLQLRLDALARSRAFESVQLTPGYLGRIDVALCPITREPLTQSSGEASDWSVDRVRNDAGYAAGNLAVMSARANAAKGAAGFPEAMAIVQRCRSRPDDPARVDGLSREQWARVAALASFVHPLPHAQAASLPLLLLPPNRLRLFNPVQALQTLASRALAHVTPCQELDRLRAALPGEPVRHDFDAFVEAYRAGVAGSARSRPAAPLHWALEDAWADPRVLGRWRRLALGLSAARCEAAVLACGDAGVAHLPDGLATDGWALEQQGYVRARSAPLNRLAAAAGDGTTHPDAEIRPVRRFPARRWSALATAPGTVQIPLFPLRA